MLSIKKETPSQWKKKSDSNLIEKKRNSYNRIRLGDLRALFAFSSNVVYLKDEKARYVWTNKRFEELFGTNTKNIVGMTCREVFKDARAAHNELIDKRVLKSKQALKYEECICLKNREYFFLYHKFPITEKAQAQPKLGCIMVDITDQKKAQNRLGQLSAGIMQLQEKERSAIARELHDELGQILTFLKMYAQCLYTKLAESLPEEAAQVDQMSKMIDDSIATIREISIRLRPKILDDLGIIKALEWHTQEFQNRSKIKCDFYTTGQMAFNGMLATTIYRIAQEALTNVAKHSKASHVMVSLIAGPSAVELEVRDNGKGFDPDNLDKGQKRICLGLEGIRERASLSGGVLKIKSLKDKGTRIIAQLPINK
jgi:PAS domain S-box-containing protein